MDDPYGARSRTANSMPTQGLAVAPTAGAVQGAVIAVNPAIDKGLAELAEVWPNLPAELRSQIVALAKKAAR